MPQQVRYHLIKAGEASMQRIQERLKELRRKQDWSQEDLAREIGVSLSTVQRWEKHGAKPTSLARRELARLFEQAGMGSND